MTVIHKKSYTFTTMKETVENWWSVICGASTAGITTTLLSINLQQIGGLLLFGLTAFAGGFIGFIAKKVAEVCWNKVFRK